MSGGLERTLGLWEERPDETGSAGFGGARLESWARRIVDRDRDKPGAESDVERVLTRELELVLSHIEQSRDVHARQLRSLVRVECYVDTELIHMEQRTPRYSPYRFPEREKLQRRLMAIEAERRKLAAEQVSEIGRLHDRLLTILNRHAQLVP